MIKVKKEMRVAWLNALNIPEYDKRYLPVIKVLVELQLELAIFFVASNSLLTFNDLQKNMSSAKITDLKNITTQPKYPTSIVKYAYSYLSMLTDIAPYSSEMRDDAHAMFSKYVSSAAKDLSPLWNTLIEKDKMEKNIAPILKDKVEIKSTFKL